MNDSFVDEECIYSSVPEGVIRDYPDDSPEMILEFLKSHEDKCFSAMQIAIKMGMPIRGTQVEVRKAITYIIEVLGEPVIAVPKGFMYTKSKARILFYACALEQRLKGLERRIRCVRQIAMKGENKEDCDGRLY